MPEAYSCFFDFTEPSDDEVDRAKAGRKDHSAEVSSPDMSSQRPTTLILGDCTLMDQEGKGIDIGEHSSVLKAMAEQFASEGWVHVPQLGVPPQCRSKVQLEADMLQNPKQAQRKIGKWLSKGNTNMPESREWRKRNSSARTDSVLYLDFHAESASTELREHLRGLFKLDQILERVACQLASQLQGSQLGLCLRGRTSMMFACYDPGGYYLPHVDADDGDDRVLTAVYYLNHGWQAAHGGALRLQPLGGGPQVEVWPEEDALVLFRADQVVHEVRLAKAKRLAITIWFKGVCGQVHADVNGELARTVPLRKLPESLEASSLSEFPWMQKRPPLEETSAPVHRPGAANRASSSDTDDSCSCNGTARLQRGPVLVCWNVVGFRLKQGKEKLAGLFVATRRLGIKDHVVLSYPEDHGIEGEGDAKWAEYIDRVIQVIDKKPLRVGRHLLLWAHSAASAAAMSVASRLGGRVLKIYMVDGYAPAPGGVDFWASTTANCKGWSDARWMLQLAAWNPGSTVLQEMAAAVLKGWDVSSSRGAQEVLSHGKRQYLNAIHPDLTRDISVISAPIFAFSMNLDEVIPVDHVKFLGMWTSADFHLERINATHMGWLEPMVDKKMSTHRCVVFDRICQDMAENLEHWMQL